MSTNENRDEQGRFAAPDPEPATPDWESLGVDFETARNAVNMQRQFENVNTRADAYRTLYDPRFDAGIVQFVQPEQEEPDDEWAHLRGQDEDDGYYHQPPQQQQAPQGFDPRMLPDLLGPTLDARDARLFNAFQIQQQMDAQKHAVESASRQAAASAGLPEMMIPAIQHEVEQTVQQYANRRPGDVAAEVTAKYADAIRQAQIAAVPPPPSGSIPPDGAPISGERQPQNFEEAAQWMRDNLPPGP